MQSSQTATRSACELLKVLLTRPKYQATLLAPKNLATALCGLPTLRRAYRSVRPTLKRRSGDEFVAVWASENSSRDSVYCLRLASRREDRMQLVQPAGAKSGDVPQWLPSRRVGCTRISGRLTV